MKAKYYETNFNDSTIPQGSIGTHRQRPSLLPTGHLQRPQSIQKIQVRTHHKTRNR